MPNLDNIIKNNKRLKKKIYSNNNFVKKEHRPWDLSQTNIPQETKTNVIDDKLMTKPNVIDDKLMTKPNVIDDKLMTKTNVIDDKLMTKTNVIDDKLMTKPNVIDDKLMTKTNVIDDKFNDKYTLKEKIINLSGIQLGLFNLLVDSCIDSGTNTTGKLNTNELSHKLSISFNSFKKSLYRLKAKTIITNIKGKRGKGGYTCISISIKSKNIALQIRKNQHSIDDSIDDNKKNTRPIYNSNNIITTINKKEEENIDSENPWMSINIFPLEQYGLKQSHLKQLQKMNCTTPEIVQESIHHMSYGLENTKDTKKYDYPIKVLMGVLKKGDVWIEEKYIDPNERALKKIIDARKRKLLAKQKLISELKDIEFNNWFEELTESKLLNIIEETDGAGGIIAEMYKKDKKISDMTKGTILKYFNETVWIQIKNRSHSLH
jgi:hypothetical protein